jgi:hypothetical protein
MCFYSDTLWHVEINWRGIWCKAASVCQRKELCNKNRRLPCGACTSFRLFLHGGECQMYIICYKRLYPDTHWSYIYLLKWFQHNFHNFINYRAAITEGMHVSNIIYLNTAGLRQFPTYMEIVRTKEPFKWGSYWTQSPNLPHTHATPIYCEEWYPCSSLCGIGLRHVMGLS